MKQVLIEGYTQDELLAFPDELIAAYLLIDEPIIFKAGSAEILGTVSILENRLLVELAQIDGGGDGVVLSLWVLARRYAMQRHLNAVEWRIHAVNCAKPNLKLRHVLERRGFVIKHISDVGEVYHLVDSLSS